MANKDLKSLLTSYFNRGFTYKEIQLFLEKNHDRCISIATLKRRMKDFGLKRRNTDYDEMEVREHIRKQLDGPGCMVGYRHVWHTLQMQGVRAPRIVVQKLLKEMDPEGTEERRRHVLKRRTYHNIGPNYAWHCDGYDKLKPFGFPIHACIDGWSRKIMWLYITRSNNNPDNIATYYLDAVQDCGGCPVKLITDLGTENGAMASIHSFFKDDVNSHRYVPSTRNQRIECWWSYFRKNRTNWWINLFKDLEETGKFNRASKVETECLWFCFAPLLQKELDDAKEHWNTHLMRKSRHDTISGRPDALYYLPSYRGGVHGLLCNVPDNKMEYARRHLVEEHDADNIHRDYFQYVMSNRGISRPNDWRECLSLYHRLLEYAKNGS